MPGGLALSRLVYANKHSSNFWSGKRPPIHERCLSLNFKKNSYSEGKGGNGSEISNNVNFQNNFERLRLENISSQNMYMISTEDHLKSFLRSDISV